MLSVVTWVGCALALAVSELLFAAKGSRGEGSSDARAVDRLMISSTLLALLGPILGALVTATPGHPVGLIGGASLAILGVVLRTIAMIALKGRYRLTPQAQQSAPFVVTGNIYSFVRHPGYLGINCALVGLSLVAWTPWGVLFCIPTAVATAFRVAGEERILRKEFGSAYVAYTNHVKWRVLPWVY